MRLGQGGLLESVAAGNVRREWGPDGALRGWRVEATATNLLTYSEQFDDASWTKVLLSVTANAAVAPDGVTAADKVIPDTSSNSHSVYHGATTTIGTTYTFSVFAKAGGYSFLGLTLYDTTPSITLFDLSSGSVATGTGTIVDFGNGWYKCSVPFAATKTTCYGRAYVFNANSLASYAGDGTSGMLLWGAQIEAGNLPTSYIPTTSAAVARSADVWTIPLVSSWFNTLAGTIFIAGYSPAGKSGSWDYLASIDTGSSTNSVRAYRDSSGSVVARLTVGGSATGSVTAGSISDLSSFRLAFSWRSTSLIASLNGATAVSTTPTGVPSGLTTLRIGESPSDNLQFGGHISHLAYFPQALSAAKLQSMTL
jgi:hypothetical protein